MMFRAEDRPDTLIVLAMLLAALVFVAVIRLAVPLVQISPDEWRCTATHTEQMPIETSTGISYRTVYSCDQWSRR